MTNPTYNPDSHVPVAIADLELLHQKPGLEASVFKPTLATPQVVVI